MRKHLASLSLFCVCLIYCAASNLETVLGKNLSGFNATVNKTKSFPRGLTSTLFNTTGINCEPAFDLSKSVVAEWEQI